MLSNYLGVVGTVIRDIAQLRSNLEVIVAVRSFDRASAKLIQTTNTLTTRILWLTLAAIGLGIIQALISLLSNK